MKNTILGIGAWKRAAGMATLLLVSVVLAGCPVAPTGDPDYDAGFLVGFAQDNEYWQGFDDGFDTVDGGTIYYTGSEIPYYDDLSYDAGYWDGVWYAYNDGYFVEYDYAFTIGFSEGYDVAFGPGGIAFIQGDQHVEWLDGGFTDGYNDGFSEGRVFGAYDYGAGLSFDWFDALLDYRDGTDLTVGGVSTGSSGPVELYVYGTDPFDLIGKSVLADKIAKRVAEGFSIRKSEAKAAKQNGTELSYRPLTTSVQGDLTKKPQLSPRSGKKLTLTTSWLERVNQYRTAVDAKATAPSTKRSN